MSTRSTIAVLEQDGVVKEVYCHFDGYLAGVGKTLLENWNDYNKAISFVEQGDASSISETLEESVFYSRDRGEKFTDVQPRSYTSLKDYLKNGAIFDKCWIEYAYLLKNNVWFYSEGGKKFLPLVAEKCVRDW